MTRKLILGLLVAANLVLVGLLVSGFAKLGASRAGDPDTHAQPAVLVAVSDSEFTGQSVSTKPRSSSASNAGLSTPFTQMYSQDPKKFAANLRGIGCPEETVKGILVAEIRRRYRAQEEALRPKPADHVPFTWSANPSERKLFQRRQQAASITREKRALLRDALGYDVEVAMPVYAMTSSEQRFEDSLAALAPEKRSTVVRAQEDYWAKVQALQERTKGFWQSADVAELEQLKTERRMIEILLGNP